MLTIIIAVLFGLLLIYLGFTYDTPNFALIGVLCIIVGIIIGLFVRTEYKEPVLVNETKLVQLSNSLESEGGGLFYVSITADNVYKYRHEVDSEYGTDTSKEYVVETLSNDNQKIIEIEDPNCKEPVLREYLRKGKATKWSFGLGWEYEYVFYVPEGTITKEVKLE